ncbi:MAG: amidohydrolase family protein [Desulfobacterales bacterium]|nr:amidohydrolase family protein [Desulfobacterales bacterium]NNM22223.1 amidohydrolase family protein [Flavobacteriaceae bacterium]
MDRREFLSHCVKTGMTIGFGSLASCVTTNRTLPTAPAHAITQQGVKPARIDAHGHTVRGLTPDKAISLMDKAGISHMVLMARGRNDALTTKIYKQDPQRILPFVSTMYPGWHRQDWRVLSRTERKLSTGIFKGVGEVMLRYYGIPSKNEPVINVPADSSFIKKLSDIAVNYNVVMTVHMEPEAEAIRSLENLLDYNKKLKLVWAHCGTVARVGLKTIGHADIGAIMDRHPNLYTDIAGVQPRSVVPSGGLRRPPITDSDGNLFPRFKKLLERHSDRVLFGLDTPWMECWAEKPFKRWTEWADKVVSQVEDTGAAERIMHKNAKRLFNI